MSLIMGLVVGLLVFMGIGIKYFKWYFLISGYNTMSKVQKEKVDVEGLGNLMGNFLFLLAGITALGFILHYTGYKIMAFLAFLSYLPITIILLIIGQKYDHNEDTKSKKVEVKVALGITVVTFAIIVTSLIYGAREPEIIIQDHSITIKGIYGTTIKEENILEIKLEDTIPKILSKTNGFDLGYILRGNFKLDEIGSSSIYIHQNKPPYIIIKTKKGHYIINYKDPKRTIKLYNDLKFKNHP